MLTLNAPAKINWFLKVLGLRDDGFHEIQSLIQKITLYDELTFALSEDLILEADADIPVEENLVYKAAVLLKDRYNVKAGAMISLRKEIPMGAGLGGGSSDAAAALIGLNKLWSLNVPTGDLSGIAAQLGSDVPFFLHGQISYAQGRGEILSPCKALKTMNILLVKPADHVSTAWAYRTLAAERAGKSKGNQEVAGFELTKKALKVNNMRHFIRLFEETEVDGLDGTVLNDLESVVINNFPVIADIKDKLSGMGSKFTLMSGSGSTVFGVFNTREETEEASHGFNGFWTAVVETMID